MKAIRTIVLIAAALLTGLNLPAETVDYKLSLTLAGVSIGAGSCSYSESDTICDGQDAIKIQIEMKTGRAAGLFFHMCDTMTSVVTPDGTPIHYCKRIHEGNENVNEHAYFYRSGDKYAVRLTTEDATGILTDNVRTSDIQIMDLAAMMKFSRMIDSSNMKVGDEIDIPMVNGDLVLMQHIINEGVVSIKDAKGKRHDCLKLSVRDWKNGKERETIKLYVTNDAAHIPVRLDIILGICFIKAALNNYSN